MKTNIEKKCQNMTNQPPLNSTNFNGLTSLSPASAKSFNIKHPLHKEMFTYMLHTNLIV